MLKYKKININNKVVYFDLDDFRYVSGKIVQSDDYIEEYQICKQEKLKKLVLLMTNKCNMQCKYCVAEQGVYKNNIKENTINIEKLSIMILKLLKIYPAGIQYIQFFGGEPLLVYDKMVEVHKVINDLFEKENIELPKYSVVTNGTLLDEEISQFINDNKIHTTISVDGTEMTHDANRIMYDGKGSYSKIMNGIKSINKDLLIVEFSVSDSLIRAYEKGMINNILESYIALGFKNIVFNIIFSVETITACKENTEKYNNLLLEYIEFILKEISASKCRLYDYAILNSIISIISKKVERNTCTAGVGSLTVTTDGRILPCYLASEEMNIEIPEQIERFTKVNPPDKCKQCWCQKICSGWCREMANGDIYEYKCVYQKMYLEAVIKLIYESLQDKKLLDNIVKNIKFNGERNG